MNIIEPNGIYTFTEVQEIFGISQPTLSTWIRQKGLVGRTFSGRGQGTRFFVGADILDFVSKGAAGGPSQV